MVRLGKAWQGSNRETGRTGWEARTSLKRRFVTESPLFFCLSERCQMNKNLARFGDGNEQVTRTEFVGSCEQEPGNSREFERSYGLSCPPNAAPGACWSR